ncbi:pilus assembly PilX family protein [Nocardioides sp. MAHUQ-72]|uniref:pilus assembly PilX family protein n=1 Tax=unclassified Nocardioides TaxID=2615069 RepID=UPI00360941E1
MRTQTIRRPASARDDRGSAMIITLMVMALVTALATTVAVLTIDNLQSSWRAKQAGSALNAADAGVSQAMNYLRNNGVRSLACSPSCTSNAWGNRTTPSSETLPGTAGEAYKAWIEVLAAYPANTTGRYRIHSTGTASGAASRKVTVDVTVATTQVPRGVFARSISGGGSASVTHESIFSTGCVSNRKQISMVNGEIDLAYGIPIGVHSSQYITEANNAPQYCPDTDNKLIHRDKHGNPNFCNGDYPYDQDRLGGSLTSTPCATTQTTYPGYYGVQDLDGDGSNDVKGSWLKNDDALFKLFGIKTPALSQAQIDQLRTMAQAQGNYWTTASYGGASGWAVPDEDNAVMFFDLAGQPTTGRTIILNPLDESRFDPTKWTSVPNTNGCPNAPRSLVIVVQSGNVQFNANLDLAASLFLTSGTPYGQVYRANGTANFLGTIYADTVNLVGNVDISLNQCFLDNASPALLDVRISSYREVDRGIS